MSKKVDDCTKLQNQREHQCCVNGTDAGLVAALRDIAEAAYGTDTPKLRDRARRAIARYESK